ncbi:MAG: hypothetical protein Ct9H300mP1_15960 [Planctomycetaceae bacterium]|nr:MAG: hypothetical protein Ct9H300mP1_15960 [Planctomycetaceae bacterium]
MDRASSPGSSFSAGGDPGKIESADLDNDGDLDLSVAFINSDEIGIFLNNGDGTFATGVMYSTSDPGAGNGSSPFDLVVADFDQDGFPDIASPLNAVARLVTFQNNGDGTFAPPGRCWSRGCQRFVHRRR